MRSASLLAVAVLVVVAVALPIQSAFAALTLDINPNPVVLGGSITFSGTGANPGVQIDVGIWQASDQCAGSPQTDATGNADNSGNYQITFSSSLSVGQYGAQTVANVPPLYPKSPCVAFTVVETPPAPPPAVGGVVMPANTLAIVAPWLAVIGLVGCISTVVITKKRET
jgi:hypothetical protein